MLPERRFILGAQTILVYDIPHEKLFHVKLPVTYSMGGKHTLSSAQQLVDVKHKDTACGQKIDQLQQPHLSHQLWHHQ
jgi:hypothetical protein